MGKEISKMVLLFRVLKRKINKTISEVTIPEPMVKQEAVDKTLYLLRRDFTESEQNDIVLNLIQRLHDKREADVIRMENELKELKAQSDLLKIKLVMTR